MDKACTRLYYTICERDKVSAVYNTCFAHARHRLFESSEKPAVAAYTMFSQVTGTTLKSTLLKTTTTESKK